MNGFVREADVGNADRFLSFRRSMLIIRASPYGETIGRRIRINQPDVENARCNGLGASDQRKDFSPFMQQPTTLSTFNAILSQQERTEPFEARLWTHGGRSLQ
jgi:hypothetical protein